MLIIFSVDGTLVVSPLLLPAVREVEKLTVHKENQIIRPMCSLQVRCNSYRPEAARDQIHSGAHSPPKYRSAHKQTHWWMYMHTQLVQPDLYHHCCPAELLERWVTMKSFRKPSAVLTHQLWTEEQSPAGCGDLWPQLDPEWGQELSAGHLFKRFKMLDMVYTLWEQCYNEAELFTQKNKP